MSSMKDKYDETYSEVLSLVKAQIVLDDEIVNLQHVASGLYSKSETNRTPKFDDINSLDNPESDPSLHGLVEYMMDNRFHDEGQDSCYFLCKAYLHALIREDGDYNVLIALHSLLFEAVGTNRLNQQNNPAE